MPGESVDVIIGGEDRTRGAFRSVGRRLSGFASSVGRATRGIALGVGAAAAGIVGLATAVGIWAKSTVDDLASVSSAARRLGTTTEFLSEMRHVVAAAGIDFEQFTDVLKDMTVRIGEAATGEGEAAEAFDALGLSAAALREMSLEEQFLTLTDTIAGLTNESTRFIATEMAMAEEATELMNVLRLGRSGINAMRTDVRALGGSLDAAGGGAAERTTGAFRRLRLLWSVIAQELALQLAPVLERFATWLFEGGLQAKELADRIAGVAESVLNASGSFEDFLDALRETGDAFESVGETVSEVWDLFAGFGGVITGLVSLVTSQLAPIGEMLMGVFEIMKGIASFDFDQVGAGAAQVTRGANLSSRVGEAAFESVATSGRRFTGAASALFQRATFGANGGGASATGGLTPEVVEVLRKLVALAEKQQQQGGQQAVIVPAG